MFVCLFSCHLIIKSRRMRYGKCEKEGINSQKEEKFTPTSLPEAAPRPRHVFPLP